MSCQIDVYHSLTTAPYWGADYHRGFCWSKVEMTAALVMGWAKVLSYSQAGVRMKGPQDVIWKSS